MSDLQHFSPSALDQDSSWSALCLSLRRVALRVSAVAPFQLMSLAPCTL